MRRFRTPSATLVGWSNDEPVGGIAPGFAPGFVHHTIAHMLTVLRCDTHRERLDITTDWLGRVSYDCPVCQGKQKPRFVPPSAISAACARCGVPLLYPMHGQRFCSRACRLDRPHRPDKPCQTCQQVFHPHNSKQRYCSRSCFIASYTPPPHATTQRFSEPGPGRTD